MKVLEIDMTAFREDGEDIDESIEDDFIAALVEVIEAFDLLAFTAIKVVDDGVGTN